MALIPPLTPYIMVSKKVNSEDLRSYEDEAGVVSQVTLQSLLSTPA